MRVEVEKLPGVMATEEAFVIFQLRVLVPETATTAGEGEKVLIPGFEPTTVTVTVAVEVPLPFVAVRV